MQDCSLRFGHVTEYDPSRHMARVNFPDLGIVSYWLPVLVSNSLKNHDEVHVDIGEHVACMMSGDGAEMGVILGAFYDDKNKPPVQDEDIRTVTFSDGVRVLYDRESHSLVVDSPELVSVSGEHIMFNADSASTTARVIESSAENITQSAGKFELSAESISISGGAGGSAGISGKAINMNAEAITLSGDILLKGNITLEGNVSCPGWCVDK